MAYDDPNDAPIADTTKFFKCNSCDHLHVALQDEDDRTLATAVISREMLISMLETIDGTPMTIQ